VKISQLTTTIAGLLLSFSLLAQDHPHSGHSQSLPEQGVSMEHAESGMSSMSGKEQSMPPMQGMYGLYPMTREASGTSWQPDSTPGMGIHSMNGPWNLMWHGYVNAVYDHQGGPRGDNQAFSESMLMGMGQRPLAGGTFGLRAIISLDALMGRRGYPLLFQTGESADGSTPLIDRQHPHDLLMELSASYSRPLSNNNSAFVYVGLPGEPALGPTAYMHRFSGMDSPEAPLTHHWLDSTHITFGVVTLGYVWGNVKLEGSIFNGREPDQSRYNIETGKLDSASARMTWNPAPAWSLQISHGRLDRPEQLEPDVAIRRTTASASNQYNFGPNRMQTTLAWGRNRKDPGQTSDGWLLESTLKVGERHTLFGRVERVENDELFREGETLYGQMFKVGKLSLGYIYDFASFQRSQIGVGALISRYDVPSDLKGLYGSDPTSYMVFMRARLK